MEGGERNVYQHHYHTPPSSSSSLSTAPSDDVSLFLHHLLLRSSPSSMPGNALSPPLPPSIYRRLRASSAGKDATFTDPSGSEDGLLNSVSAPSAAYFSGNAGSAASGGVNVPSSSVGASENETDHEYDCESEEGLEALVEEGQAKHAYRRSSSKRTRAAEVHNLSEKRRRSRINEKMKALQNLIPYSNKTDKASMLDEAIEYLKQLQLQVQMLSMRNGMSLHPMCLPGVLQLSQARMGHMNLPDSLPPNQENPAQNNFSLPSQSTAPNQPSLPVMPNTEASFGLESHFGSFQLQASSEEICREVMVAHELANAHPSDTIL